MDPCIDKKGWQLYVSCTRMDDCCVKVTGNLMFTTGRTQIDP
jgi:hypothetical protein